MPSLSFFTPALLALAALVLALAAWRRWRGGRSRVRLQPIANIESIHLEELLRSSPLAACITEAGRISFMNRSMKELSGATSGCALDDLFSPGQDRERAAAAGRGVPCPPESVLRLCRPDGSTRDVAMTTLPAGGRGEGVYLHWLFDRTALRQAERAATDAETRQRSVIQSLADSIVIIDERGKIQSFSPSAEKTFGYRAKEIVGRNISVLMPPPDRDNHDHYLKNYIEVGWATGARERSLLTGDAQIVRPEREVIALRKDGTKFPVRLVVSEVDTGSERFFVGLLSDLTDRKRLERELADRAAFQEALLQSIPYPMFAIDASGHFLSCNTPHTDVFGMTSAELKGKTIRDLPYLSEAVREQLVQETEKVVRDAGRYSHELTVADTRGAPRVMIFSADGFRTSAGGPGGLIGLLVDITEQKRTAAELKVAKEKAERAHAIIEAQKQRMQDELDVGRQIQLSMVPGLFPILDAAELWGSLRPAREVGGDFYDFFMPTEDELWLCIGDVSGKGVPAALFMAVTKTLIKSFLAQGRSPGDVTTRVNEELSRDNENSMFVTAFIARLNLATGELHYTNAGHNPPLLRRAGGVVERHGTRHGAVLGAAEGVTYGESSAILAPGDTLLLYTDGVTEALNTSGEFFTDRYLEKVLQDRGAGCAREVATSVMDAVDIFADGAEQADDITLLALRYGPHSMPLAPDQHPLHVPNDLNEVTTALKRVEDLVALCGGDRETQTRFAQAFDELLSNIIKYGFPEQGAHLIECEIRREDGAIVAVITDDGIPFNLLDQPNPDTTLPLEARSIGGLGIHLVRRLFENVQYRRESGRNVVTLTVKA